MQFKVLEVKKQNGRLHVTISHDKSPRETFSFSDLNLAKDNKYIEEIKKHLNAREKQNSKKITIDKSIIGTEIKN